MSSSTDSINSSKVISLTDHKTHLKQSTVLNKNQSSPKRSSPIKWGMWGIAALFYLYETFLRASPSVMTHDLMKAFGVTSTTLGILSSCYYYAYVALQIPCGLIVDKLGTRFILTLSCFLCIIGTFLFATSETLWIAGLGRLILGAGSACAFISCLKITIEWFSPLQFAFIAGLTNMMGTLGGLCAGKPLAVLVNTEGWRQASLSLAYAGFPIVAIIWFLLKQKKPTSPDQTPIQDTNQLSIRQSLPLIAKNPQIWLAGIVGGFMYLPISAFAELWGVPFFMHSHHINNEGASSISHLIFIGMALGSPIAAWLLGKMKSITKVMQFSALLGGSLFVAIACTSFFPLSWSYGFVFFAGFFIGGQVLCFTIAKNHVPNQMSGTVIGFTNALVMFSGIIFQPLLGHILDLFWDGSITAEGIRLYSAHAYQMSMLTIPLCFLASALLLVMIKDKNDNSDLNAQIS